MKGTYLLLSALYLASAIGSNRGEGEIEDNRDLRNVWNIFRGRGQINYQVSTCSFEPDSFSSDVVIDFFGSPELITDKEVVLLEESFLAAYNDLVDGLCDSDFRSVSSVKLSIEEFETQRRMLQQGPKKPRRFSFRLMILGNCRRCVKDPELFSDAFRRLEAIEEDQRDLGIAKGVRSVPYNYGGILRDHRAVVSPFGGNKLVWKSNEFNCECEAVGNLPNRPPGVDEFNAAFDSKLKQLVEDGSVQNVAESLKTVQVREIECEGQLDDFTSEVIVDATGDPDEITDEELTIMKDVFLQSHRMTNENVCDPEFRILTGAEISVEATTRRLDLSTPIPDVFSSLSRVDAGEYDTSRRAASGATSRNSHFRPFRFRFRVSGRCKGCKSEALLFNDAFRRNLQEQSDNHVMHMNRDLGFLNNDACLCVRGAPVRTPTEEEFEENLNDAVQDEVSRSNLPNVESTVAVVQVDDSLPSSSPSSSPSRPTIPTESPIPSPSPSMTPTRKPTTSRF